MTSTKISHVILLLLAVLLPVFFLPTSLFPLPMVKTVLVLVGVVILAGFVIVRTIRSGQIALPWHWFFLFVLALPAAYLVSGSVHGTSLSLFGYGLEVGTFASILIGMTLLFVIIMAARETRDIFRVLGAFFLSGILIAIFAVCKVFSGGGILSFGIMSGNMGNPIGSWTDYGIMFACLALLSLLAIEMLELRKGMRLAAYAVLVASVFLLMVINFSVAWALLAIFSLILTAYFATMEKHVEDASKKRSNLSRVALVLFLVSLLFFVNPNFGSKGDLGTIISNHFAVQNVDVRPSISSTSHISASILKTEPILGSGPNTFAEDWFLYKTPDLNSTQFWNVSFPFGIGFFPTQVASVGLLGTVLWLAFLGLFLLIALKAILHTAGKRERFVLVSTLVLSVFLLTSFFVYVPSSVIFYLAFMFMGCFLAAVQRLGIISTRTIVFADHPGRNFVAVLTVGLVSIGAIAFAFISVKRIASVVYYQKALALASVSGASPDAVEADLDKAIALSNEDLYYRSVSDLALAQAQSIASGSADAVKSQAFQDALSKAITAAQSAINIHPENYSNWTELGSIYAALVPAPLSVDGAYANAKQAYAEAAKRNPLSPEVPLLLARLDYNHADVASARQDIQNAITLKADYADAYFLLTQIAIDENDAPNAIASAKTAALLSPGNAGVFFELGLLEYSAKDYADAAQALTQAITIVPSYANAKYFLGLSLDKLGNHDQALVQFEDLLKTNPDNADLPIIIANIEAGRDALSQAPSGSHPEHEETPPIDSSAEATQ